MLIAPFFLASAARSGDQIPKLVTYGDFNHITYVAASQTKAYFATTSGITIWDKLESRWLEPLSLSRNFQYVDVDYVGVDEFDRNLFIGVGNHYWEYDVTFDRYYPTSERPEPSSFTFHLHPPPIMFTPSELMYNSGRLQDFEGRTFPLTDLVNDGAGNLWIGTWGYGAATSGSVDLRIEILPYGLLQSSVTAIYDDGIDLWLGGIESFATRTGITAFDPIENSFRYIESGLSYDFPRADVNCIAGDESFLYLGTNYGLLILDLATQTVIRHLTASSGLSDENVISLMPLGDSILVGTSHGLNIVFAEGDSLLSVRPTEFDNLAINDMEQIGSNIWIATNSGAYRLTLPSANLQRFVDPDLATTGEILSLDYFDDHLWFATSSGLLRLNLPSGDTELFDRPSIRRYGRGLAVNDTVAAVTSENGFTLLYHSIPRTPSREFTTDDGLPSYRIYCLKLDGDYLWIGSDRGLTRFLWNDPDRID